MTRLAGLPRQAPPSLRVYNLVMGKDDSRVRPQSIFDWDHMLLYLSGAMDFANDRGGGWRSRITRRLVEIGIPAERILDPCKKPSCVSHNRIVRMDEGELLDQHRAAKDWDGLVRTMKVVAHFDLRCVDKSDFIIASFPKRGRAPLESDLANFDRSYNAVRDYIGRGQEDARQARNDLRHLRDVFVRMVEMVANAHVPTYGTLHEIVVARQQKKPVFVIWESDGMSTCSAWVAWLVGHRNVFKSMDACVNRIDRLMHRREPLDMDDWLLFALPGSDAPDGQVAPLAPPAPPPPQEGDVKEGDAAPKS